LIYEALDSDFWPRRLVALADAGGRHELPMLSVDRRANVVSTFAAAADPICSPLWQKYWRPDFWREFLFIPREIIPLIASCRRRFRRPLGFYEFWQPAQLGLIRAAAPIAGRRSFSALIFFSNAPTRIP